MQKLLFILFLVISFAYSEILEIGSAPIYETKNYIEYTLANEENITIDDLKKREWSKNKSSFNTLTNAHKPHWARVTIKNISNQPVEYYFKSENQFTYQIEYFLVKRGKIVEHIVDGVISKNQERIFNTNHMIFPLYLEAQEEAEIFFKITNYNKIDIDFSLVTRDYLIDYYQSYNMIEGLFFGGMLLMMLYNLFLYFLLKFRAYLYYVSYVFWLSIYFIGLFGFSQRYFEEYTWIFYISSGSFFISLTLFVQSILNLKEKLPKIHKILNFFIFYFIIATLTNIVALENRAFFYAQLLFNLFFILVPIFIGIIIFSTYYLAYYKNDKIAQFYSIIWTLIASIGLLLPLEYLNIFRVNIPSDYIFQFLTLFEVLCFSFILAYKIKLIEQEKKSQEKLLVQQNRLASMGEMISVIAHQWRQPLSEINGVILTMDLDYKKNRLSSKNFNKYLDTIEMTTAYMSNTINDFMDFFKQDKKLEELNLSQVIQSTLNLVSITNKEHIQILYKKRDEPIIFFSYKSELIQALLIVINNAIDACSVEKEKPSTITIEHEIIKSNIHITISDTGCGIPPEILNRIYDPYFTTKHQSKGTGLGLYILKKIVEQKMGGLITIVSSKSGTKCNISLPMNCEE